MSISYEESGVSREEGYKAVSLMKEVVAKTMNNNVLNNIGSFGAMYELGKYNNPVLVSGTDGVGTKLEIAFTMEEDEADDWEGNIILALGVDYLFSN